MNLQAPFRAQPAVAEPRQYDVTFEQHMVRHCTIRVTVDENSPSPKLEARIAAKRQILTAQWSEAWSEPDAVLHVKGTA